MSCSALYGVQCLHAWWHRYDYYRIHYSVQYWRTHTLLKSSRWQTGFVKRKKIINIWKDLNLYLHNRKCIVVMWIELILAIIWICLCTYIIYLNIIIYSLTIYKFYSAIFQWNWKTYVQVSWGVMNRIKVPSTMLIIILLFPITFFLVVIKYYSRHYSFLKNKRCVGQFEERGNE
jgi:hypothetical protein